MKQLFIFFTLFCINNLCYGQFGAQQTGSNRTLSNLLDTILLHDQKYRKELSDVIKKHGQNSKEELALSKKISVMDAENQKMVSSVLDKYGWLGPETIGSRGSRALFIVLQHAPSAMQEKYLPMMRSAVKQGKAKATNLAMLEDRVLMEKGKNQIYGSQLFSDSTGMYVCPIEDVDNLDKRRAEIGLMSMKDYLSNWNIVWNVEKYKKELPNSPAFKRMKLIQADIKSGKKPK